MSRLSGLACPYLFRSARPISLATALLITTSLSSFSAVYAEPSPQVEIHLEALDNLRRHDNAAAESAPFQNQLDDFYGAAIPKIKAKEIETKPIETQNKSFKPIIKSPDSAIEAPAQKPESLPQESIISSQKSRLPIVALEEKPQTNSAIKKDTVAAIPEAETDLKAAEVPATGRRTVWTMMRDLAHFTLPAFGKKREDADETNEKQVTNSPSTNEVSTATEEIKAAEISSIAPQSDSEPKSRNVKNSDLPPALPHAEAQKQAVETKKELPPSRYKHEKKSPAITEKPTEKTIEKPAVAAPSLFKDSAADEEFSVVSAEKNTEYFHSSPTKIQQKEPAPVALEPLIKKKESTVQKDNSSYLDEGETVTPKKIEKSVEKKNNPEVSELETPKKTVVAALVPKKENESRFIPLIKKPAVSMENEKEEGAVADVKPIKSAPDAVVKLAPVAHPTPPEIPAPAKVPAPIAPAAAPKNLPVAPAPQSSTPAPITEKTVPETVVSKKTTPVPTATAPVAVATLPPPIQKMPESLPKTQSSISEPVSKVSEPVLKAQNAAEAIKAELSSTPTAAAVATNVVSAAPPPARAIITQAPAARETIKEPATEATPEKTTAELSKPLAQPVLQAAPAISPDTVLFQLKYSQSQTAASDSERDAMLAALAPYLYDRSKRIRVVSYAAPDDAQGNKSRRLSLQRAIQVRSLLMNAGFESLRVHVQAMGDKTSGSGPADRVDLFIISE